MTPLTASSMLSSMGCEKSPDDAGNLIEFAAHGGDQFIFVLVEDRTPLLFRFQIDEEFGVEKAGGIGAVVGTADLAGALRDFGKRAEHDARLVRDANALVGAGAGSKRAANPERAFVEVRQEFGADGAAEGEVSSPAATPARQMPTVIQRWRMAQRTRSAIALDQRTA